MIKDKVCVDVHRHFFFKLITKKVKEKKIFINLNIAHVKQEACGNASFLQASPKGTIWKVESRRVIWQYIVKQTHSFASRAAAYEYLQFASEEQKPLCLRCSPVTGLDLLESWSPLKVPQGQHQCHQHCHTELKSVAFTTPQPAMNLYTDLHHWNSDRFESLPLLLRRKSCVGFSSRATWCFVVKCNGSRAKT